MTTKLNTDNGLQGQTTEGLLLTAVWRNGGFSASYDGFVVGSSAVLRLNFCAKNPPLRQAAKRYRAFYQDILETIKQEYRKFFKDNFQGLRLRKPLFYSWHIGLRFNLQVGETDTDEYFQEVNRRASTIFRSAFENSDTTFFMFMDYKYKRRKINFKNFLFKQIHQLAKTEVIYTKEKMLYDIDPKFNIMNVSFIKLKTERINYENIIAAIAHKDFPSRQPRLDKRGVFSDKEVYFVNLDKKLVLHMYDDRGLDIISSDKEILRPIYLKYSDWLLDYDRKTMDEIFGQKNAL